MQIQSSWDQCCILELPTLLTMCGPTLCSTGPTATSAFQSI